MNGYQSPFAGYPIAFKRRQCEVCGKDVAVIRDGRPVRSHRRSAFHQKALTANKRAVSP